MKYRSMANFIRARRKIAGVSQQDISKALGFGSSQFISNMERGLCTLPPKYFKPVAKILKVSPTLFIKVYLNDERIRITREVV